MKAMPREPHLAFFKKPGRCMILTAPTAAKLFAACDKWTRWMDSKGLKTPGNVSPIEYEESILIEMKAAVKAAKSEMK